MNMFSSPSDMVVGNSGLQPAQATGAFAMGRSSPSPSKHGTTSTSSVGHKARQRSLATLSRKARTKRRSVQNLLAGFEVLRSRVPSYAPDGVHLTKKEILCAATAYIADLRALLRDADRTDSCQKQCCHQPVCLHPTGGPNFGVPSRASPDHYVSFSDDSTSPSFVETRPYFHQLQPSSVASRSPHGQLRTEEDCHPFVHTTTEVNHLVLSHPSLHSTLRPGVSTTSTARNQHLALPTPTSSISSQISCRTQAASRAQTEHSVVPDFFLV